MRDGFLADETAEHSLRLSPKENEVSDDTAIISDAIRRLRTSENIYDKVSADAASGALETLRAGRDAIAARNTTLTDVIRDQNEQIGILEDDRDKAEKRYAELEAAATKVCEAQSRWLNDQTTFPGYAEDVNTAIEVLSATIAEGNRDE